MGLFDKKNSSDDKVKKTATKVVADKADKKETESMEELYKSTSVSKDKQQKTLDKKVFKYEQAYKILKKPVVTEKVTNLGAENKYVFMVANDANKVEVAKAIYQTYNVKPIKVNMINKIGKVVRTGRTTGKRKDWKKAIVTLAKGETIKVYEGV